MFLIPTTFGLQRERTSIAELTMNLSEDCGSPPPKMKNPSIIA